MTAGRLTFDFDKPLSSASPLRHVRMLPGFLERWENWGAGFRG